MFNNLQHQLLCEIEGIENSANAAANYCEDEEWQFVPECIGIMVKRMKSAIKICVELGLIEPPQQKNSFESTPTHVEVIDTTENSNA